MRFLGKTGLMHAVAAAALALAGCSGIGEHEAARTSASRPSQVIRTADALPDRHLISETVLPSSATPTSGLSGPVAVIDDYRAASGRLLSVAAPGLLQNDLPGTGGGLTVVGSTPARYGTVSVDDNGSFSYQSAMDFSGFDSFAYTVRSASGQESTATVTILITGGFPPPTSTAHPAGQDPSQFRLTFQDEFDGDSLDTAKWNTHLWYEQEPGLDNYRVSDGSLKIWFEWRRYGWSWVDHNRTIDTDGKFEQTYGFFEIEARFPVGRGLWGAFWLYAHPGNDRPEIDIVEVYPGAGPGSIWSDADFHAINYVMSLHKANGDYSWHEIPFSQRLRDFAPYENGLDLSADFHKYAVKWEPSGITYYFDGQQIGPKYLATDSYYSKPMYVLLDLWVGGESGYPTASGTPAGIGNSMEVNYVRVWQFR